MPSHPPRSVGDPLEAVVDSLMAEVNDWFSNSDTETIAENSRYHVWLIFTRQQEKLWQLFRLVEAARAQQQQSIRKWPDTRESEKIFYKRITADGIPRNQLEHSRASILAIILSAGVQYLLRIWDQFLTHLGMQLTSYGEPSSQFNDFSLPIETATFFHRLPELARTFEARQHKYCQVRPGLMLAGFSRAKTNIRKCIDSKEITVKCESLPMVRKSSESKQTPGHPAGSGIENEQRPEEKERDPLRDIFPSGTWIDFKKLESRMSKTLVRDIFTGWYNATHPLIPKEEEHPERRKYFHELDFEFERFFRGLAPRLRIFAILVYMNADALAKHWRKFVEICQEQQDLCDGNLPVDQSGDFDSASRLSLTSSELYTFYWEQFRFTPFEFRSLEDTGGEAQEWTHGYVVLPLVRRQKIGEGCYGAVYDIEFHPSYSFSPGHTRFALKVISRDDKSYAEWDLAKSLEKRADECKAIMKPVASVRTLQNVLLLMPLADRDLRSYMESFLPDGPANDEDCHDLSLKFGLICDIAKAIEVLHSGHWNGQARVACIHSDIKAQNILFTERLAQPLQLSDFGIARLVSKAVYVSDGSSDVHTPREVETRLFLAQGGTNFPPELEGKRTADARVDIWGFGTVFAEYVAWLSGGEKSRGEFECSRRIGFTETDYVNQSYGRQTKADKPELKSGIVSWFENLIKSTPHPRRNFFFQSCWELISEGLLECEPQERLSAEELRHTVDVIRENLVTGKKENIKAKWGKLPRKNPDGVAPRRSSEVSRLAIRTSESGSLSRQDKPSINIRDETTLLRHLLFDRRDARQAAELMAKKDVTFNWQYADKEGNTFLHAAVYCDTTHATQHLIQTYPELNKRTNYFDETALFRCAKQCTGKTSDGPINHARLLLDQDPSVVEIADRKGHIPLWVITDCSVTRQLNNMFRLLHDAHRQLDAPSSKLYDAAGNYKDRYDLSRR